MAHRRLIPNRRTLFPRGASGGGHPDDARATDTISGSGVDAVDQLVPTGYQSRRQRDGADWIARVSVAQTQWSSSQRLRVGSSGFERGDTRERTRYRSRERDGSRSGVGRRPITCDDPVQRDSSTRMPVRLQAGIRAARNPELLVRVAIGRAGRGACRKRECRHQGRCRNLPPRAHHCSMRGPRAVHRRAARGCTMVKGEDTGLRVRVATAGRHSSRRLDVWCV